MKIAFACYLREGRISGPSNSLSGLVYALNQTGLAEAHLYTSDPTQGEFVLNGVQVRPLSQIFDNAAQYNVASLTGMYDLQIYRLSCHFFAKRIPYMISPRGSLMRESHRESYFRKKIAYATFTGRLVRRAAAVHFLNEDERSGSSDCKRPVFIARNGTNLVREKIDIEGLRTKRLLYIGRLDIPHKGLDILLRAIKKVEAFLVKNGWRVELFGPPRKKDHESLARLLERLELRELVAIRPPVVGSEKIRLLTSSQFFLHPSRYEGQPQAVIEALLCGCVPIVTPGTNMAQYIQRTETGLTADLDVDELALVVRKAAEMGEQEVAGYRDRARSAAVLDFAWETAAHEFLEGTKTVLRVLPSK